MDKSQKILQQVKEGYNQIASHFSATRYSPWKEFDLFSEYIKEGDKILDLACGNGRLYKYLMEDRGAKVDYQALDNSENLIKIARKKYPSVADKFQVGEMTKLPYGDGQFNIVVCLASFHHLPDKKMRQQALAEIFRVLKPGGYLLMTNWSVKHWPFWQHFFRNFWQKKSLFDFFFPWKNTDGSENCLRYYHVFRKSELDRLLKSARFKQLKLFYFLGAFYKRGVNLVSVSQK